MARSNALKGEVAFGPDHVLVFTIDALAGLEERFDRPISEVFAQLEGGRISTLRALVWAGLADRHPGLSEAEAGELILAAGGLAKAGAALMEALVAAFPEIAPAATEAGSAEADPRSAPPAAAGKAS